jgi:hypothetical protein
VWSTQPFCSRTFDPLLFNLGIALDSNLTHGWNSTVPRKKMAWEYNNNKLGKPLTYFVLGRANGHLKVPKITFA